jgi:hypothetical protein
VTVFDKKRAAVEAAKRDFASSCQAWMSNRLPGTLGSSEPHNIPTTFAVTFKECDLAATPIPDYARLVGVEFVSHAATFDSHPYVSVRSTIDAFAPYTRLLAFTENLAAIDGWITNLDAAPMSIHMLDPITSLLAALWCSYDYFDRRLQRIRLAYNDFGITNKPKVKKMLKLRADLLITGRDIACFQADLVTDLQPGVLLWDHYQTTTSIPLVTTRLVSSLSLLTWFQQLRGHQETSRAEHQRLTKDLHEFSGTASDIMNFKLNRNLLRNTVALVVLSLPAVVLAIIGIHDSQHNQPNTNYVPSTTTTTTTP